MKPIERLSLWVDQKKPLLLCKPHEYFYVHRRACKYIIFIHYSLFIIHYTSELIELIESCVVVQLERQRSTRLGNYRKQKNNKEKKNNRKAEEREKSFFFLSLNEQRIILSLITYSFLSFCINFKPKLKVSPWDYHLNFQQPIQLSQRLINF